MLVRMNSGSGFEAGKHARFRAGGDDDVLRFERLRAAGLGLHLHLAAALQRGVAGDALHLVSLQQHLDALGVLVDDLVLAIVDLG